MEQYKTPKTALKKHPQTSFIEDDMVYSIEDPELQGVISDVISYSEDYEIHIEENESDWF